MNKVFRLVNFQVRVWVKEELCALLFYQVTCPWKRPRSNHRVRGSTERGSEESTSLTLSLYLSHVVAIPRHFVTDPFLVYCLCSRVLSLFHVPGLYESWRLLRDHPLRHLRAEERRHELGNQAGWSWQGIERCDFSSASSSSSLKLSPFLVSACHSVSVLVDLCGFSLLGVGASRAGASPCPRFQLLLGAFPTCLELFGGSAVGVLERRFCRL